MTVKLNNRAFEYAIKLIEQGAFVFDERDIRFTAVECCRQRAGLDNINMMTLNMPQRTCMA